MCISYAQVPNHEIVPFAPPPYNIVRFDEDWTYLRDPGMRMDRLDAIKYISLGRQDRYLSVGGEFRGVYERVLNDNWSNVPFGLNSFGLERFQIHTDVHLNPHLRTFVQLESGLEQGRPGGPRPIDEKRLDFLNAFIDFRPTLGAWSPTIRIGKQELQFGSARLISVREGPNVRQAFFGFRIDQPLAEWIITGFAVRPAVDRTGFFDDGPLSSTEFWGVTGNRGWKRHDSLSFNSYYYGLDTKLVTYNRGSAHEVRQTFGGNLVLNPPDNSAMQGIRFYENAEAILQVGSFGQSSILAWGFASETGVSVPKFPPKTRISLRMDLASGDRGGKSSLGTFNPLFPNGDYFGVLADTGPGPVNFRDIHPKFILPLPHEITVVPDWLFWWRQSLQDGVYTVPGTLLIPAGTSQARFVGHRPGVEMRWQINRHLYMQTDYGVFFAGSFLRQSNRPQNLNYFSSWLGYKF
jgi:hypothetical protein